MLDRLSPASPAFDPLLAAAAASMMLMFVWLLVLSVRVRALGLRYRAVLTAASGTDIEAVLREYLETAKEAHDRSLQALQAVEALSIGLKRCVQRSGIVRFDAFEDVGGRLSFALALMDAPGNGFLLTSLYGRDGCRIYAKALTGGASAIALSEEEKAALQQALSGPFTASKEPSDESPVRPRA